MDRPRQDFSISSEGRARTRLDFRAKILGRKRRSPRSWTCSAGSPPIATRTGPRTDPMGGVPLLRIRRHPPGPWRLWYGGDRTRRVSSRRGFQPSRLLLHDLSSPVQESSGLDRARGLCGRRLIRLPGYSHSVHGGTRGSRFVNASESTQAMRPAIATNTVDKIPYCSGISPRRRRDGRIAALESLFCGRAAFGNEFHLILVGRKRKKYKKFLKF